jgi:septum formation protein
VAPEVDELTEGEPDDVVLENARRKARAGRALAPEAALVLGADTEVVLDGRVLGKASDAGTARERLRALSGQTHEVLGAVALINAEEERSLLERTRVSFVEIDDQLLELYIDSGEWRDRAGAYAVQGLGSALIDRIDGDLANVIGLPLRALLGAVPELLVPGPDQR